MDELPYEEEVGTADWVFDDDATPVCSHCFETVSPLDHYCQHCGEAVGQWTPYIPWVLIPYWARFFERLCLRLRFLRDGSMPRRLAYLALVGFFAFVMIFVVPPMP